MPERLKLRGGRALEFRVHPGDCPGDILREYAVAFMIAKHGAYPADARAAWLRMQHLELPETWEGLEQQCIMALAGLL